MAEKAPAKATAVTAKMQGRGVLTMFTMKGDPIKALSGFKLPAGAHVAIVSEKPESVSAIRKSVRGRVARVTEVIERAPRHTQVGREPLVDKSAFEPDARSGAMLEGVRIAQQDLREAGGAYDLDEVRTLMRGASRQAIDKRVQDGSLFAVPGPSNRRSYPTLQFNAMAPLCQGSKPFARRCRQAIPGRCSTSSPSRMEGWPIANPSNCSSPANSTSC
ncbi:hypothetical protein [Mesorhizobium sp. M0910]|uniref:hypothetical protein n=1 Tax=Mesorhizobium sp. M0910 TaxID=2957025 RepID=UPI00333DDDCD